MKAYLDVDFNRKDPIGLQSKIAQRSQKIKK